MRIGIIGSGQVGGTLGKRWARGGHTVAFSSRNPASQEMKNVVAEAGSTASSGSVAEVAAKSDVLLLATPWKAAKEAIQSAGNLSGKILIDATNPILPDLSGLEVGCNTSAGELVAEWAAGAKVVKAFNTVGFHVMTNPKLGGQKALLFCCGDDGNAKSVVAGLATELDFDARDAGPLRQARLLEPFALLWIGLAISQGYGLEFAFQTIRRG